ncbi:MAG: hypothetical protein M1827_000484 [Pycnora praestabilis]|nr:MAG: hypothetical protein M1827_000484 [Pycnora praestabilis]
MGPSRERRDAVKENNNDYSEVKSESSPGEFSDLSNDDYKSSGENQKEVLLSDEVDSEGEAPQNTNYPRGVGKSGPGEHLRPQPSNLYVDVDDVGEGDLENINTRMGHTHKTHKTPLNVLLEGVTRTVPENTRARALKRALFLDEEGSETETEVEEKAVSEDGDKDEEHEEREIDEAEADARMEAGQDDFIPSQYRFGPSTDWKGALGSDNMEDHEFKKGYWNTQFNADAEGFVALESIRDDDDAGQAQYDHQPDHGPERGNVTKFLEAHRHWGPGVDDLPPILFRLDKGNYKNPVYKLRPVKDDQDRIILDNEGHPLRDFHNIPLWVSGDIEGWRLEAICREDSRIELSDFFSRMPKVALQPKVATHRGRLKAKEGEQGSTLTGNNAMNMRKSRFRQGAQLKAWNLRAGGVTFARKIMEQLNPSQKAHNTTWGLPELTAEEMKELKNGNKGTQPGRMKRGRESSAKGHMRESKKLKTVFQDSDEDLPSQSSYPSAPGLKKRKGSFNSESATNQENADPSSVHENKKPKNTKITKGRIQQQRILATPHLSNTSYATVQRQNTIQGDCPNLTFIVQRPPLGSGRVEQRGVISPRRSNCNYSNAPVAGYHGDLRTGQQPYGLRRTGLMGGSPAAKQPNSGIGFLASPPLLEQEASASIRHTPAMQSNFRGQGPPPALGRPAYHPFNAQNVRMSDNPRNQSSHGVGWGSRNPTLHSLEQFQQGDEYNQQRQTLLDPGALATRRQLNDPSITRSAANAAFSDQAPTPSQNIWGQQVIDRRNQEWSQQNPRQGNQGNPLQPVNRPAS